MLGESKCGESSERLAARGLIAVQKNLRGNSYTLLQVPSGEAVTAHGCTVSPRMGAQSDSAWVRGVKELDAVNQTQRNKTGPKGPNAQARPGHSLALVHEVHSDSENPASKDRIADLINRHYRLANHGIEAPWSSKGLMHLNREMARFGGWGPAEWERCVVNRFAPDGVRVGEPPEMFLPELGKYLSGPLNRFGGPKDGPNGYDPSVSARTNRNRASLTEANRRIDEMFSTPSGAA